jgi:hypothetical protein
MNEILKRIKRGSGNLPNRILVAGPEGIGKSTLASKAPNPIFICAEEGLTGLDHVQRFPPSSLEELNSFLDALIVDAQGFHTLVIDTTDWLERFLATCVCQRDNVRDIEAYGFGKGYVVLENELVAILHKLDLLREKQKMGVVLLAHVTIRTFNDPRGESWDRYEMKGHKRFTGILREWPDACLFAVFDVFKSKKKGERVEKTIGGERVLHTQWSPAWDAKNRLNLPETLPMEWEDLERAIQENSPGALCASIRSLHKTAVIPEPEKPRWSAILPRLETLTSDKLKAAIERLKSMQGATN